GPGRARASGNCRRVARRRDNVILVQEVAPDECDAISAIAACPPEATIEQAIGTLLLQIAANAVDAIIGRTEINPVMPLVVRPEKGRTARSFEAVLGT